MKNEDRKDIEELDDDIDQYLKEISERIKWIFAARENIKELSV